MRKTTKPETFTLLAAIVTWLATHQDAVFTSKKVCDDLKVKDKNVRAQIGWFLTRWDKHGFVKCIDPDQKSGRRYVLDNLEDLQQFIKPDQPRLAAHSPMSRGHLARRVKTLEEAVVRLIQESGEDPAAYFGTR